MLEGSQTDVDVGSVHLWRLKSPANLVRHTCSNQERTGRLEIGDKRECSTAGDLRGASWRLQHCVVIWLPSATSDVGQHQQWLCVPFNYMDPPSL